MESIIENLSDPSWWFTGLIFIVIPWILSKVFRKSQITLRRFAKRNKIRNLIKVKNLRWDSLQIAQLIGKASANYVLFISLIFVFLYSIAFTPLGDAVKSVPFTILLATPIYIFQILWLIPDSLVREAIKSRRRIKGLRDISTTAVQ